jgi:hypothetical protein
MNSNRLWTKENNDKPLAMTDAILVSVSVQFTSKHVLKDGLKFNDW